LATLYSSVMSELQQTNGEVTYQYDGTEHTTLAALSEWAALLDER